MPRSTTAFRISTALAVVILTVFLTPPETHQLLKSNLYKSLSNYRPALYADPAIVLIELDPEPDAGLQSPFVWADFFLILHEMGAELALLMLPVAPPESSSILSMGQKESFENRFDTEFNLISKNIATLFDAIRYGSVRPKDTTEFVEDLLSLIGKSKERLLNATIHSDTSGHLLLMKAQSVFGEDRLGTTIVDLGYSLPTYASAFAVAEYPHSTNYVPVFRRLSMKTILGYVQLDEELFRILSKMDKAGYFINIPPEMHPTILYDHIQDLLYQLLDTPQETTKKVWIEAKKQYEQSVKSLLTGKTKAELIHRLHTLLAEEPSEEAQAHRIQEQKQIVVESFDETQRIFDAYTALQNLLSKALHEADCIVGTRPDPQRERRSLWSAPTAAEAAAVQINSFRSGRRNIILTGWKQKISIAVPGLLLVLLLSPLSLPLVLFAGPIAIVVIGGAYSFLFIFSGIFINPINAALVSGAGATATLLAAWLMRLRYAWQIGPGFGSRLPRINSWVFGTIEGPPARQLPAMRSAILAVRAHLDISESMDGHGNRRAALLNEFHSAVAKEIRKYGGVILGAEDLIVISGFGTPLDRASARLKSDLRLHVNNALLAASNLSRRKSDSRDAWSFGIDTGECYFYFSSINGISVEGQPAVYARILSALAVRYESRVLTTLDTIREAGSGWTTKKLDALVDDTSGKEKPFYALIGPKQTGL